MESSRYIMRQGCGSMYKVLPVFFSTLEASWYIDASAHEKGLYEIACINESIIG